MLEKDFVIGGDYLINIRDLNLEEIENELLEMGEKKYRAKQVFAWLYRNVETFEEMTDLSKDLIKKLSEKFYIKNLEMKNFQKSKDGTIKYLFQLNDGHAIESVIKEFNPDIIHSGHIWLLSNIASKYNIPTIITSHGTDIIGHNMWSRFHKYSNEAIEKCSGKP